MKTLAINNIKVVLGVSFFSLLLVLGIFLKGKSQEETRLKEIYTISVSQLSKSLSLPMKIQDAMSISRLTSKTVAFEEALYLGILNPGGTRYIEKGLESVCGDQIRITYPVKYQSELIGIIASCYRAPKRLMSKDFLFVMILSVVAVIGTAVAMVSLHYQTINPVKTFLHDVENIDLGRLNFSYQHVNENTPPIVKKLYFKMSSILEKLRCSQKTVIENKKKEAYHELSQQVAHDIRSPLAALEMATRELVDSTDERSALIKNATKRIKEIADNLLFKNKVTDSSSVSDISSNMASEIIIPLIKEKKAQFRDKSELEIKIDNQAYLYGVFISSNPEGLQRVISNVINNAAESMSYKGTIDVKVLVLKNNLEVLIKDNGPGISKEVLPRVTERGVSIGKSTGSGLGLYHAKKSIEEWGGRFEIESEVNMGTTVKIILKSPNASS